MIKLNIDKKILAVVICLVIIIPTVSALAPVRSMPGVKFKTYDVDASAINITGVQAPYDFLVWNDSGTYKAKNSSGSVVYSGPNATTVINDAYSSASKIQLAAGTYNVTQIVIPDGGSLIGMGKGITKLVADDNLISENATMSNSGNIIQNVDYISGPGVEYIEIAHLSIDGNAINQQYAIVSAISIQRHINYSIHDVDIKNIRAWGGILAYGYTDYDYSHISIYNCDVRDVYLDAYTSYACGIWITGPGKPTYANDYYARIADNYVENVSIGIFIEDHANGVTVSNNIINGTYQNNGIQIAYSSNVSIIDNIVIDAEQRGISCGDLSEEAIKIERNDIVRPGLDGIIINSNHTIVNGNRIRDGSSIGIKLDANHMIVHNNVIESVVSNPVYESDGYTGNSICNNIVPLGSTIRRGDMSSVIANNLGTSPVWFGNLATAPTPFGEGDWYYNTSSNVPLFYDGSVWTYANGTAI